jgi:hypothetical protein
MALNFTQTSYKRNNLGVQKISVGSTRVLSAKLDDHINTIRVVGNVPFWFSNGSSTVTASSTGDTDSLYVPGDLVEYVNVQKFSYVSVIADGTSGFVCISEMTQ